jgi:hypothetical protein
MPMLPIQFTGTAKVAVAPAAIVPGVRAAPALVGVPEVSSCRVEIATECELIMVKVRSAVFEVWATDTAALVVEYVFAEVRATAVLKVVWTAKTLKPSSAADVEVLVTGGVDVVVGVGVGVVLVVELVVEVVVGVVLVGVVLVDGVALVVTVTSWMKMPSSVEDDGVEMTVD